MGQTVRNEEDTGKLQKAIDNLVELANKWGMACNVAKCKVVHYGYEIPGFIYTINGQQRGAMSEEETLESS
jgi:hypothetical protein